MPKQVPESKFTEHQGLDRIAAIVHAMKHLWRPISQDDVGIDGEIEILAPTEQGSGYTVTGGLIKVQSKSGESYIKQDTATSFSTPVSKDDIDYWLRLTFPVIFIVYHPKDDRLYWKDIRAYVRTSLGALSLTSKITFDKQADEFSAGCAQRIGTLAGIETPRVSVKEQEKLYTNLFRVERLPAILTYAVTPYRSATEVREQMQRGTVPFCVVDGHLYTLADLRNPASALRSVIDDSHIHDLPFDRWLRDPARHDDVLYLLNQLLRLNLGTLGLHYYKPFKRWYFPREDDTSLEFTRDWNNVRSGRKDVRRTVVKYYEYGPDHFWRHLAGRFMWQQFGGVWYLQVIPKYFYTADGVELMDRDKIGPYTTRLKAKERNQNVLNHILFWADTLARGEPKIVLTLYQRPVLTLQKEPVSGIAPFAIPLDPAVYDEPEEIAGEQLDMFSQFTDEDDFHHDEEDSGELDD